MEWIDFAVPKTLSEALELMVSHGERARPIAGGTDILVQLRGGRRSADLLVDVKAIPELNQISYDPQTGLVLGAALPCYRIYQNQHDNQASSNISQPAGQEPSHRVVNHAI